MNSNNRALLALIPSIIFSVYYLMAGKYFEAALVVSIGAALTYGLKRLVSGRVPKRVDDRLTTAVFHMYGLSLGETSPSDLIETIAENREYGFYSKVFRKIRELAVELGYGYTKATAKVAEAVKPPLKDILVRCTNIFSTTKPRGYLEIESSTLMEEYSGLYERSIETIKTLAGIFTAFQSVTVFLIMTVALMTIFMIDPSAIVFGYVIAVLSLILMYYLFRVASPREKVVYIGKYPPTLYRAMKWSMIATCPSLTLMAIILYFARGPPYAFIALGLGVIIPGIFGYKLEGYIREIDTNYPTFLKALGENLASTSDLKSAFTYILYMELGPLHKLVKGALARLKLGLSHKETLETLSSEAASYQAHISNKILLDSLYRGANPLEIGNALGNRVVKTLEFRKKRVIAARSFQTIMVVMQCMTVVLLAVLRVLAEFLSSSLVNLPYFGFNAIPLEIIDVGNIVLVFTMAVINAMTVKEVSASYWGTFLLNLGLLLIVSGLSWMAADTFIRAALGAMPSIQLPV